MYWGSSFRITTHSRCSFSFSLSPLSFAVIARISFIAIITVPIIIRMIEAPALLSLSLSFSYSLFA